MIDNKIHSNGEIPKEGNGILKHIGAFFLAGIVFVFFVITFVFTANSVMANVLSARGVVIVPELTGAEVVNATRILESLSLKIDVIDSEYHELPEGLIIAQIPSIGRQIYKNRTVEVITSRGPKIITMPELRGVSFQSINDVLRSYELRLGSVSQRYSNDVPAGFVIETFPPFRAEIMAGIEVNIVLSTGRDPLDPLPVEPPPQFHHPFFQNFFDESVF